MTEPTPKQPDRVTIFPGTVDQFAKFVPEALRQLYKRDTEHLAEKFSLDIDLVNRMRQRNLKLLAKEAELSPEQITQLEANNAACVSTGLDFYPNTQQLVEDFTFVLDESMVKRDFIIHTLQNLQQQDLTADKDNFIREAWPLLKFLNEKKEQLSSIMQVLSSNTYIRRTIWRCTLAYNEKFDRSASIEAIPPLNHLGYTLIYFQDGYHAGSRVINKPLGDKFLKITRFITDYTGSTTVDFAVDASTGDYQRTEVEDEPSSRSATPPEDPITFVRSRNRPKTGVANDCLKATEQWLDYNKRLTTAAKYGGIDKRTLINRLCDTLDLVADEKRSEWRKKITERGHTLDC